MTDCRTCQNAVGLLAEIVIAVRQLQPEEQQEFRAAVLARNLTGLPATPRSNFIQ